MNPSTEATPVATQTASTARPNPTPSIRRGVKKAEVVTAVENHKWPKKPFTLNDAYASIGIYHWYVTDFIKRNGTVVGDAPKAPGARGKAAKLYQLNGVK